MTRSREPFGPDDLSVSDTDVSSPEAARALAMGRELEALAAADRGEPGSGFVDRVMAAVEAEPVPQPAVAAGRALRAGRAGMLLGGLRDAWRVAFSGGRPLAVRAQALALVLLVAVGLTSLGGVAAVGAAGALGLIDRPAPQPSVAPSPPLAPTPSPSVEPSISPSPSPSPSPTPTETLDPTETPGATETHEPDDRTARPGETDDHGSKTPRPTGDDHSGPGGGGSHD
jgi:hypothetical protein